MWDIALEQIKIVNMKYIITETQRDRLMVRRRLPELKDLIKNLFPFYYPCDYDSLSEYMMAMKVEMFETLTLDWFEGVDEDVIWDMVTDIYSDYMADNYISNCGENQK